MSLFSKLNKGVDVIVKIIILVLAFAVALFPIAFIFGHETLNQQPWSPSFESLAQRKVSIDEAKALQISNIHLKESGSVTSSDVSQTFRLADFVCYTLQDQGAAVVRKNFETKSKKKGKKSLESPKGYKTVQTLHENPPLKALKSKLSKYIDFQGQALINKHWVIAISGQLDSHLASEIEAINDQNPEYKFIIVSPLPLKHKLLGHADTKTDAQAEAEDDAETPATQEETPEKVEQDTVSKKPKEGKKAKKQKSKVKVKKVKQEEQIPAEPVKEEL